MEKNKMKERKYPSGFEHITISWLRKFEHLNYILAYFIMYGRFTYKIHGQFQRFCSYKKNFTVNFKVFLANKGRRAPVAPPGFARAPDMSQFHQEKWTAALSRGSFMLTVRTLYFEFDCWTTL
jgi:hypothetical protein